MLRNTAFHETKFSLKEVNLELLNQAQNIPVFLPSSPIKIWDKSV